jgi:hypothetical protein
MTSLLQIGFTLMVALAISAHEQNEPPDLAGFLQRMQDIRVTTNPSAIELETWRSEARETEANVSLPALIRLWIVGGQSDFVQLEWWRKRGNARLGRMLIIAFYECAITEPSTAKPNFAAFADRFAEPENNERSAELQFVQKNRAKLAKEIVAILQSTDSKFRGSSLNAMVGLYEKTARSQ